MKNKRIIRIFGAFLFLLIIGLIIKFYYFSPYMISIIESSPSSDFSLNLMAGMKDELASAGYQEGKDFAWSYSHSPGTSPDVDALVKQSSNSDVIITLGDGAAKAVIPLNTKQQAISIITISSEKMKAHKDKYHYGRKMGKVLVDLFRSKKKVGYFVIN